jgi:hypothetical protein
MPPFYSKAIAVGAREPRRASFFLDEESITLGRKK